MVPQPIQSALHPLLLLDELLSSLAAEPDNALNATDRDSGIVGNAQNRNLEGRVSVQQNGVRRSNCLEGKRERVFRVSDFLFGGQFMDSVLAVLEMQDGIHQICANPSKRIAFLVKGVSSSSARGTGSGGYYFCLFPSSGSSISSIDGKCYCSCRSFFEKAKHDPKALCKHLLAIALIPYLDWPCRLESVTDEEFATLLLNRAFS